MQLPILKTDLLIYLLYLRTTHLPQRQFWWKSLCVEVIAMLNSWTVKETNIQIAANQDLNEYIDLKYVIKIRLHANVFAGVLEFVLSMKKLFFSAPVFNLCYSKMYTKVLQRWDLQRLYLMTVFSSLVKIDLEGGLLSLNPNIYWIISAWSLMFHSWC